MWANLLWAVLFGLAVCVTVGRLFIVGCLCEVGNWAFSVDDFFAL